MAGFTNRGKYLIWQWLFNSTSITAAGSVTKATPTSSFYGVLITDSTAPTADINTLNQLTEIASGNGYVRKALALTSTVFDNLTENDTTDQGTIQIADQAWTATGGPLPSSGSGASYFILVTDNTTTADVLGYFGLGGSRTVSDTQILTVRDAQMNGNEV